MIAEEATVAADYSGVQAFAPVPFQERLARNSRHNGECIEWTGTLSHNGYAAQVAGGHADRDDGIFTAFFQGVRDDALALAA